MDLQEYETRRDVELTDEQVVSLRRALSWLTVTPSVSGAGLYDLTASSYVGVWEQQGLSVRVLPKFDIRNLAYMLGFSRSAAQRWMESGFGFLPSDLMSRLVIPGFLEAAERAFAEGVLQGYRTTEEELPYVRGRVDFSSQVQRRFGMLLPVNVTYDEFTSDILENRLVKAAVDRLRRLRVEDKSQVRRLRGLETILQDVCLHDYEPGRVPFVKFNRLNRRYEDVIAVSRLILENASLELERGVVRSRAFFVDMNYAFEDFIVRSLRQCLRANREDFVQGGKGRRLYLDSAARVRLRPDFSWWSGSRCLAIGDVKYKSPDFWNHQGDLYQAEAYSVASGAKCVYLVYAEGGETADIAVRNVAKTVKVRMIDLSVDPQGVADQLARLASEIQLDALEAVA